MKIVDEEFKRDNHFFLEVLSSVSKKLIGINLDREYLMEECLREVGLSMEASRAYICLFSDNLKSIDRVYEWCNSGVSSEKKKLKGISTEMVSWWMNKLSWNEVISLKSLLDMPREAEIEREILTEHGVKSILVIPIYYRKLLVGYIGLDDVTRNREWDKECELLIKLVSDKFASAIEKLKIERTRRVSARNSCVIKERLERKVGFNIEEFSEVLDSVLDTIAFDTDVFNNIDVSFSNSISDVRCNKIEMGYLLSKVLEGSIKRARRKICCLRDGQDRVYNYLGIKTYGEESYLVCKIVDNGVSVKKELSDDSFLNEKAIIASHGGQIFFNKNALDENEVIIKLPAISQR